MELAKVMTDTIGFWPRTQNLKPPSTCNLRNTHPSLSLRIILSLTALPFVFILDAGTSAAGPSSSGGSCRCRSSHCTHVPSSPCPNSCPTRNWVGFNRAWKSSSQDYGVMYQGVNIGELETMVLWYMYALFFELSHMRYSSATYCCLPYEI